jgi:putative SOS response-associated peptidase YedK
MVERERWDAWLDPRSAKESLLDLLTPAAPGRLEAYPVSTLVSNVRNNGPELLEPLPLEQVPDDVLEGVAQDGGQRAVEDRP